MSPQQPVCPAIESDLLSVAADEAGSAAAGRVEAHVGSCQPCRDELACYRALEGMIDSLRRAPLADDDTPPWRPRSSRRASPICARAYRVVGSRACLAGYAGGLPRKRSLPIWSARPSEPDLTNGRVGTFTWCEPEVFEATEREESVEE
jgi:anti-sigma factor RsiW